MSRGATYVLHSPPPPVFGWAAIAAVVAAYDAWALYTGRPTLSSGFWGTSGWMGKACRAVWWGVTVHLMLGNRQVLSRYVTIAQWEQWQAFVSSKHAKLGRKTTKIVVEVPVLAS